MFLALYISFWCTGILAYTAEEQTLLQFAGRLQNFEVQPWILSSDRSVFSPQLPFPSLPTHLDNKNLKIAIQLLKMQEVAAANHWHGWGLDNNTACPATQISTSQELWCEPDYPGGIDQTNQSWTGVTCTAAGAVTCLSLPGWGLSGNISTLVNLHMLKSLQLLNLANNSLTGVECMCLHIWSLCVHNTSADS